MPPNTKKCETCNWRESEIGYPSPCPKHTTPSPEKCTKKEENCASTNQHTQIMDKSVNLEKSEHDGTCRTPECYEKRPTPAVEDWEYGNLTIDKMKNIIEVCDVKFVGLKQDCLNISFAPRNATGKAWQELKERMHRIIGE